jgi:putative glutathione S-transferase
MSTNPAPRVRPREAEKEIDANGAFVRQPNRFIQPFGPGPQDLKAEPGRYRLIWAKGCNWSNRSSIVRELLGIDAIGVNLVGRGQHEVDYGWEFVFDADGKDPVTGVQFLSELYYNADDGYAGRPTVPALVDVTTKKVVNNDYHRLTNYLEVAFAPFHKPGAPDLYPEALRPAIDRFNNWLFHHVNNGVYKCMFAQSIGAYRDAYDTLFRSLDLLDDRLSRQRFLFGDYVTDSDVRLYVTLARFDIGYYRNFGPIKKPIAEYRNLWPYARDLWSIPAFRNNTYFRDFGKGNGNKAVAFVDFNTRFVDQIDFEAIWGEAPRREYLSLDPSTPFLAHEAVHG